jgi:hypothetical protein
VSTRPHTPPMAASNEAEPDQLGVARAEGGAYARALEAMEGDRELFTTEMPFLWHAKIRGEGALQGAGADRPARVHAPRPRQRQALRGGIPTGADALYNCQFSRTERR